MASKHVCERCGSGLLDGKHIASYPPCNGAADLTLADVIARLDGIEARLVKIQNRTGSA